MFVINIRLLATKNLRKEGVGQFEKVKWRRVGVYSCEGGGAVLIVNRILCTRLLLFY